MVNAVVGLLNSIVYGVVLPNPVTDDKGGSTAVDAEEPDSVISPVVLLYIRSTIWESEKSSLNRMGERYTAPGVVAGTSVLLALKTMVFSA